MAFEDAFNTAPFATLERIDRRKRRLEEAEEKSRELLAAVQRFAKTR